MAESFMRLSSLRSLLMAMIGFGPAGHAQAQPTARDLASDANPRKDTAQPRGGPFSAVVLGPLCGGWPGQTPSALKSSLRKDKRRTPIE